MPTTLITPTARTEVAAPPAPVTVPAWTAEALADLTVRIAVDGAAAHAEDVAALAAYACDRGVPAVLLTVLTDTAAPEVVRQRAYARVAAAVGS